MRSVITVVLTVAASLVASGQTRELGTITFPTSASPAAQEHFLRGVAWLHSFEYEDAVGEFQQAQKVDPSFALAYWGEALSYSQPLWGTEDVAAARAALARLAAASGQSATAAQDAKAQGLLDAVKTLFGEGERLSRAKAYALAMERLAGRYPNDNEIASFSALALLGTAPHAALAGGDDAHASGLAGSELQRRAAAVLQIVLARNPKHPGATHYLIHTYDDPAHARLALPAARAYASIAPASSHAQHMPAHVFLQLGMWDEAARSDQAAFSASDARVRQRGLPPDRRDYHSLSWLQYEYLQLGRYRDARNALSTVRTDAESGSARARTYFASMLARQAIETRAWSELQGLTDYRGPDDLFAVAFSAAMGGDLNKAEIGRARLQQVATSDRIRDLKPIVSIMERQLAAVIALKIGQSTEATRAAERAAMLEDQLPPSPGRPHPVKPSRELLGEILLEVQRPADAIGAFRRSLDRTANRGLSLLGLVRALQKAGQQDAAREQASALLSIWRGADKELPERVELEAAARK